MEGLRANDSGIYTKMQKLLLQGRSRLKEYTDWRVSDWVAGVDCQIKAGKKVMLVFNTINGEDLQLKIEDVPLIG